MIPFKCLKTGWIAPRGYDAPGRKNRFGRFLIILPALLMAASLEGCGPGFPILTGEQENLIQNVDRLVKENETLKKRVEALEGGGGGGQMRKDIDELKKKTAETNSGIETVRQELSFVQGSAEENDHQKEQLKDSLKSVNASLGSVNERLLALENGARETGGKIEGLKNSSDANEKKAAELKEMLASVDKRTASLEGRLAASEATALKKEARQERPGPEQLYLRGYRETVDKDYPKAAETFQEFLSAYPEHKFAGNAHYWLGEIYYARGDWERAIIEFDKVVKKFPKGEKVAASILKQGYSFEKMGANKEAKVLLKEVGERFPGTPEAGMAKKHLQSIK